MVAGVLSILVLVTTVTYGASLDSLVAHPRLYGWNWDYLLSAGTGAGNAPAAKARALMDADPFVSQWSGMYAGSLLVDGQDVPVLGERPGASIQPPLIDGHRLLAADQVVLAPGTFAQLHARLGGTVSVVGSGPAHTLTVVGVATFPAAGSSGGPHMEMGEGALVDDRLIPAGFKNPFNDPVTGPQGIFVRMRSGAGAAGVRSLHVIAAKLSNKFNFGVAVMTVLHPAEIVNYHSAGTTPAVLGGALGAGVIAALLLTLLASVRARRRDLALLKALGFQAPGRDRDDRRAVDRVRRDQRGGRRAAGNRGRARPVGRLRPRDLRGPLARGAGRRRHRHRNRVDRRRRPGGHPAGAPRRANARRGGAARRVAVEP